MFTLVCIDVSVILLLFCSSCSILSTTVTAAVLADDGPVDSHHCRPIEGRPPCVCQIKNINGSMSIIDLTSLPELIGKDGSSGFMYLFSPCVSLKKCGDDTHSAVCQEGDVTPLPSPYSCGHVETGSMDISDDGHFVIQYSGGDDDRQSHVTLYCDPNAIEPVFTVIGERQEFIYDFSLTSECACPDGCRVKATDDTKSHHQIVGIAGTVILSAAFVAVMSYIILGVAISLSTGKRGADVIPHKDFWLGLCGLIKDGCVFTFSPICSKTKKITSGYEKL